MILQKIGNDDENKLTRLFLIITFEKDMKLIVKNLHLKLTSRIFWALNWQKMIISA